MFDTIVRGGSVVTTESVRVADIGIRTDPSKQIGSELSGAKTEIDARGLLVFPA